MSSSGERKYRISILPPLLNSSNPWATSLSDLRALYNCSFTGAVTTRTSLLTGFTQHPTTHQYTFFSTSTGHATSHIDISGAEGRGERLDGETSSLNNLGYSPIPFKTYISMIVRLSQDGELTQITSAGPKPFIISVTGSAEEVAECYTHLLDVRANPDAIYPHPDKKTSSGLRFLMEINLSCPNIPDKSPPAYDGTALSEYISRISSVQAATARAQGQTNLNTINVPVGIKTPPFTYQGQFQTLLAALEKSSKHSTGGGGGCPISFVTATNTLGSCFVSTSSGEAALGGGLVSGIGGMAGDALHPLALGNVKTIRAMLDSSECEELREIAILGIGGVKDAAGFNRMTKVGASAVGVGTALGREGVAIFRMISEGTVLT